MAASCSGVATPRVAASPMTTRRTVECPTRKPALTAMAPSRRSRYCENDRHSQAPTLCRASRGMPSTTAIMRWTYPASSGPRGAMENPQFPPSTVVTPWTADGLAVGSHSSWAS